MELMLFGANSEVGAAIAKGIFQKYEQMPQRTYNRDEIEIGLSSLSATREQGIIVVISIGVLERDPPTGHGGMLRQFNINAGIPSKILEVALSNRSVREVHVASSIAALAPRPGFVGYHISKRALDEVASAIAIRPPTHVSIFVWRFPFIPSKLNKGRRAPMGLKASLEEVTACVASTSKSGVVYLRRSHWILGKALRLFGIVRRLFTPV